ncbi:uncharacterized protein PgNI_08558 [Pyricularia grisea]|uniref:non-specific serine/threonine protein kinase n=1 Tax=Pyricularia grisea TaxID=148305 RepID=A0A6P8AUZ5_PYRGI|nr:uncharacterized protein PgNI_08558 [Pyricularia grisea]TLD05979.1 hypothetical protein PgNI_08558 [Pyricularia grisea]
MSLIPYHSSEDREIVLRHNNALVVRDRTSRRLEIRRITECPTCHQSLHPVSSGDRPFDVPPGNNHHEPYFVSPNYFRLLQAGHDIEPQSDQDDRHAHRHDRPPSSPVKRLVHRVPHVEPDTEDGAEFMSSTPSVKEGARIRRNAFSPNYFRDFFVEERELGRGGKGVVLLVRHQLDGVQLGNYACKRVPVGDDHAWLEKVLIEVELLANLTHPNLVAYKHVWLEEVTLNRFGPQVACAFILQQYCNGGDLHQYVVGQKPKETTKEQLKAQMRRRSKGQTERPQGLTSHRRLHFDEIYSIFKDITSGLVYLHESNYIHRDLKPSNCLLHRQGKQMTCLISDFGEVQQEQALRNSTGSTGTISWCAPEVLVKDRQGRYGNFTTKSDVFSMGMILYFLCFGRLPYQNANMVQEELEDVEMLRAEIKDWKGYQYERRERPDLPDKVYLLLKKLLSVLPEERPSAAEVLRIISNESNLDAVPRGSRGGTSNMMPTGRVRNLDSPMPPSTPVNEPVNRFARPLSSSSVDESESVSAAGDANGSPQPTIRNSIEKIKIPTTPRSRLALATAHSDLDISHESPSHSQAENDYPANTPPTMVPLLMPPATTMIEQARHRIVVVRHHIVRFLLYNGDSVAFIFRLGLFLVKVASLTRPCWPYVISSEVGAPLVAIAGMDLGIPTTASSVGMTSRYRPGRPMPMSGASGWRWDWRVSILLFCLHFVALWAVSRWGNMCHHVHNATATWHASG